MVKLNWTPQSIHDLENIAEFIARDSKRYSIVHIRRIREKARMLKTEPKVGRIVPEVGIEHVRELIFGNYRIIYRIVSSERIDVLTVHHAARLLKF